ncbi:hypothetical protein B484DRAFT_315226, partial [Ochromonadaceae sp. CCMP2298]
PTPQDVDRAALYRKIKLGNFKLIPARWSHISHQAIDLIHGLLTLNPLRRLTADEALAHPWMGMADETLRGRDMSESL